MDVFGIIEKEGYRVEDLKPEDQRIIKACDLLVERLDNLKNNLEFIDEDIDEETIIGKIKVELYTKVINKAVEWAEAHEAELQIALAEADVNL